MAPVIDVAGLVKHFGSTLALEGLDLRVEAGEIHGFLGPNGAGKTTTIRTLLGVGSLTDTYFATSLRLMALVTAGFAVQAALRLRSEESAQPAEAVLAARVSRWHWAASHLSVAAAGSAGLLVIAGLGTGISYALAGGWWSVVPGLVGTALAYAPAIWVMTGLAAAAFGLVPRLVDVAWGLLAIYFVIGLLIDVLRLPGWGPKLSPFEQTPALPAAHFAVLPLAVLCMLAAGLFVGAFGGFRRRDIG